MFPTAEGPIRAALRQFLDVAIEFATLGEYTLDGPAAGERRARPGVSRWDPAPAATSPGPRSPSAAVSPGARSRRAAEAAGERLATALAASLRPSTAAARALHAPPPAGSASARPDEPARGLPDALPPHLELFVQAQAAELARCVAGQRRERGRRRSTPAGRRPGTPRPVPQPCLTAGD